MPKRCAVTGCPNIMGHRIPSTPEVRKKWIEALGLGNACTPYDRTIVCYKHFLPTDYTENVALKSRKRLKFLACPSVFLNPGTELSFPKPKQEPVQPDGHSAQSQTKTYDSPAAKKAASIQEVRVKMEHVSSDEEATDSADESIPNDEAFELPVEELMIKQEPDESSRQVEDPLSLEAVDEPMPMEDEEQQEEPAQAAAPPPSLVFVNKPTVVNKQFHIGNKTPPIKVVQGQQRSILPGQKIVMVETFPLPTDKFKEKIRLEDFSRKDMKNRVYADTFYALAMYKIDSLRKTFGAHIRKLEEELADVKKELLLRSLVRDDPQLQDKKLEEPDATATASDAENLKRKADEPLHSSPAYAVPPISDRTKMPIAQKLKLEISQPELEPVETLKRGSPKSWRKSKSPVFSGAFRIVELEYFINAIGQMHHHHYALCPDGNMTIDSETLSGICGEWTFKCAKCDYKRVILTDPSSCTNVWNPWLTWMVAQNGETLHRTQNHFANLRVPFLYHVTSTTLKVLAWKRQIGKTVVKNKPQYVVFINGSEKVSSEKKLKRLIPKPLPAKLTGS